MEVEVREREGNQIALASELLAKQLDRATVLAFESFGVDVLEDFNRGGNAVLKLRESCLVVLHGHGFSAGDANDGVLRRVACDGYLF